MICNGGYYYDLTKKEKRDVAPQGFPIFVLSCGFSTLITQKRCDTIHPIRSDYQIIYVNKGCLHYIDNNKQENVLPKGSFLIYKPREPQNYTLYLEENPEIFWCHFSGSLVSKLLEKYDLSNKNVFLPQHNKKFSILFNLMLQSLQKKPTHYIDLCAMYFQELIILLSAGISTKEAEQVYPAPYNAVINYLDNCYFENLTLNDLSKIGSTNYKTLTSYFLKFQNTTPMKYLTNIRLKRAEELLIQTVLQINEIANAVGYNDPLHFTKSFSKKYGMSPKQYRKNYSNNENFY